MAKKPTLTPANAKAAVAGILDRLPPATRITIERDIVPMPPKNGWRRYRAGNMIRLVLDLPIEPPAGELVET